MNDKKFNIDLISLDEINLVNASLENHTGINTIDQAGLEVVFQYQLQPAINLGLKKAIVTAEYEIRAAKSDSHGLDIVSSYSIRFLYSIKNLPELAVLDENGIPTVNDEMIATLLNITYSTSRGIIYTRCLGTAMDGLILPVISTTDLFNSPSAIKPISAKK